MRWNTSADDTKRSGFTDAPKYAPGAASPPSVPDSTMVVSLSSTPVL